MIRNTLGYLPQDFGVYPNLTAIEFLRYMAALKGIPSKISKQRIAKLLILVNLQNSAKRPLSSYSGGMKQRVGIAQALLNDPQILILDEPTAGLDPEERIRFRHLLSELAGDRIIILSSHIVSDIEAIATDVVFINKGELIVNKTPLELMNSLNNLVWNLKVLPDELPEIRNHYNIVNTQPQNDDILIKLISEEIPSGNAVKTFPNLEDAYMY